MKLEVTIRVSKSNSRYNDPSAKRTILIDIPGSNFDELNIASFLQGNVTNAIAEFNALKPKHEEAEEAEVVAVEADDEIPL